MNIDLAFADAARPTPVVVLRLPMLTYALGHELLLQQRRNPLLLFPTDQFNALSCEEQCRALGQAAIICAQDMPRFPRLWAWRNRRANWPLEIAEFRNYLAAGRSSPPSPTAQAYKVVAEAKGYYSEGVGRSFGAPPLARLFQFVSDHRLHETLKLANPWHFPYGLAAWLYFSEQEAKGNAAIENFEELEEKVHRAKMMREIEEEDRQRAEEQKQEKESGVRSQESGASPDPFQADLATPIPVELMDLGLAAGVGSQESGESQGGAATPPNHDQVPHLHPENPPPGI